MAVQQDDSGQWVPLLGGHGVPLVYERPADGAVPVARWQELHHSGLHPDDILAQSFVLETQEPSLDSLEKIGSALGR